MEIQFNRMTEASVLKMHPNTEYKFNSWKARANKWVLHKFMMTCDGMPDAAWRRYYDDKLSPFEAVEMAVEEAWYDMPGVYEAWHGEEAPK